MTQEHDTDIFIDADAPYSGQHENTYEQEVLRQMRRCVDVLSREVTGGMIKSRTTKTGQKEEYIEDVRELIINGVDTFRILMLKWIKDKEDKLLKDINEEIKKYREELGEKVMLVRGKGHVKIKNLGMVSKQSIIWRDLVDYKAEKYRKVFEILIIVYNKNKDEIARFSEE